MGHERLGTLPRTVRWRAVVDRISGAALSPGGAAAVADLTLTNVRLRFDRLADDGGVQTSFRFLVALALATRSPRPDLALHASTGVPLEAPPSPIALTKAFRATVGAPADDRGDLAAKALADALAQFAADPQFKQGHLFETTPWDTWREANTAAGFCELARLYFSNLTSRYLRYFLDREASAALGDPIRLDDFRERLGTTVDSLSRHAFETSKITQSFAAGWFQKHTKKGMPSEAEVRSFLSFALHKIREELRREAGNG